MFVEVRLCCGCVWKSSQKVQNELKAKRNREEEDEEEEGGIDCQLAIARGGRSESVPKIYITFAV